MSDMPWGVLGGPDRVHPGLMAARSGTGVPWPGRRITAGLRARLLAPKLAREVEQFLAGRS